jgi:hypothetical protein
VGFWETQWGILVQQVGIVAAFFFAVGLIGVLILRGQAKATEAIASSESNNSNAILNFATKFDDRIQQLQSKHDLLADKYHQTDKDLAYERGKVEMLQTMFSQDKMLWDSERKEMRGSIETLQQLVAAQEKRLKEVEGDNDKKNALILALETERDALKAERDNLKNEGLKNQQTIREQAGEIEDLKKKNYELVLSEQGLKKEIDAAKAAAVSMPKSEEKG